ncbi:hypothetical protein ACFWGC_13040 [Cytobacillus pseudoceanisediminis]|uniref:hypothetical protein n=1 Tax=Cytobacillus pseudoceanisediminis TaxID=3051614 RepID=UPI003664E8E5
MSISVNYFEKFQELYNEVKISYEKLNKLQSALDRKVSDIYHDIERTEFNIVQGHEIARTLKETLQQRRVVKEELALLFPVYNMLMEHSGRVDEQYNRAVRRSYSIKENLKVTMGIDEVLVALEVE